MSKQNCLKIDNDFGFKDATVMVMIWAPQDQRTTQGHQTFLLVIRGKFFEYQTLIGLN